MTDEVLSEDLKEKLRDLAREGEINWHDAVHILRVCWPLLKAEFERTV